MLEQQHIIKLEPEEGEVDREPLTPEQEEILQYLGDSYAPGMVGFYASTNTTEDGKTLREEAEDTTRMLGYVVIGAVVLLFLIAGIAVAYIT